MFQFKTRTVEVRGKEHDFYYLPHPGAVAVVPVERKKLALIRQYRPSVDQQIWEVPAGTLEPGEDPAECAVRELEEETGYVAGRVTPIAGFYLAPGYSSEYLHLFVAEELSKGTQSFDEGENIEEIRWYTFEDAFHLIDSGELVDAKSVIAVQALYFSHR